jgi:hypothetical protein
LNEPSRVVVLHISVAVRWWLRHLPDATLAERLLFDSVPRRETRLSIHTGMENRVLDEVARDLAGSGFDESVIAALPDDVARQFALLYDNDFA